MTNPDSTQTVNERVALARRWHKESQVLVGSLWFPPSGIDEDKPIESHPPDFCGKWEYAGSLLGELLRADRRPGGDEIQLNRYGLSINGIMYLAEEYIHSNDNQPDSAITEAITRAWDAWKQGEEE